MASSEPRAMYRPSGSVDWGNFIPLALLTLLASAVGALVLHLAFSCGFYIIAIMPLGLAAGVGALAGYAVTKGHCRNSTVATALGLAAGVILYLGHYHLSMLSVIGWQNFHRVDVLPKYIEFRMATDVIRDTHSSSSTPRTNTAVDVGFHWFFFAMEALGVLFIVPGIALASARRTYCEKCGAWQESFRAIFRQDTAHALVEALHTGRLQALAEIPTVHPLPNTKFAVLCVDTCCSATNPAPACANYFSVGVLSADKNAVVPERFGAILNRATVNRVELSRDELAQVAVKFPKLRFAAVQAEAAAAPAAASESGAKTALAEELTIPAPHAGTALPGKVGFIAGFLDVLPPLLMLVGMFGGLSCAIFLDPRSYKGTLTPIGLAFVWLGIAVSIIALLVGIYFTWRGSPWTVPYLLNHFRAALANARAASWIRTTPPRNWSPFRPATPGAS